MPMLKLPDSVIEAAKSPRGGFTKNAGAGGTGACTCMSNGTLSKTPNAYGTCSRGEAVA